MNKFLIVALLFTVNLVLLAITAPVSADAIPITRVCVMFSDIDEFDTNVSLGNDNQRYVTLTSCSTENVNVRITASGSLPPITVDQSLLPYEFTLLPGEERTLEINFDVQELRNYDGNLTFNSSIPRSSSIMIVRVRLAPIRAEYFNNISTGGIGDLRIIKGEFGPRLRVIALFFDDTSIDNLSYENKSYPSNGKINQAVHFNVPDLPDGTYNVDVLLDYSRVY